MKKKKIGLPRAFLYHREGVFWRNFFECLGLKVIISPETNREILELGINNTIDECCLSYKIYIGHVLYLSEKCDYILTSRICDYGKKNKVCTRLNGIYDNIKCLLPPTKIIDYNIEHTKLKYEFIEFIKIGLKLNKGLIHTIYSYIYSKIKQKKHLQNLSNGEKNKLNNQGKKVLILSHFYNINDKYISNYIIEYLKNNNITTLFSDRLNRKLATTYSEFFSDTLYWKYSKEMIGSLYYYQYEIDGVIFISTYPCGIDSLVNNLAILKNKHIPILNILIDENITELNLETKLESFIDILGGQTYE